MYKITKKVYLNNTEAHITVHAPFIADKAKAGQFVIVRAKENSARIPFTVFDTNPKTGEIGIIYQIVGGGTLELDSLNQGDSLQDLVGPLGNPTEIEGIKTACVVGGGVGCAIAYPIAKALNAQGTKVDSVIGFRNKDLIILEDEFAAISDKLTVMTDDGSNGNKGFVTTALEDNILNNRQYDMVFAIGPLPMMKFVSLLTKKHNIPTTVSMNSIMIDGTGMCGGCRLTVGGEMKFACVDGPDFDGHLVDFDEAISRSSMYKESEKKSRDEACRIFGKEL
ncbi:MAG: sulfide/dihydroorotate dehydrogenase-like FAD/NAD-binding protein [Eubacteriales bacterium]|nr:sulfide/dihydroorotate dehydrogenase-like FAD/NAD-binding protein [Eubacteriales bacterium]